MKISGICISKVLFFVWSASYWDRIIDGKRTPSRTRRNSRWYIYWYSDTSIVLIYTCLKEADKARNSILLLFFWAEECFSSSSMFKYWMLITKFQISYLVFIRSMREHSFKPLVKIMIFLVKSSFNFNYYNYARWLSMHIQDLLNFPITCPQLYQEFQRGNFVIQISGRQFSLIHYTNSLWRPNRFPESC